MATVRIFRSTDIGAPALSNVAGSLIGILDACLVNGFSTQVVTSITRSGTVATATKAAHGFRDGDTITIAGATQTDYNITATISNVTTNTWDYTVANSPATPATGSPTAKKAGAGWTKPFNGTNLAAYQMGVGSNQHYLRVDDTALADASVRAYETMSDVNTGTGAFPTVAQQATPYWAKASGTNREWIVIASDRLVHFWADSDASTFATRILWTFGQIKSYKTGDAFGTILTTSPSTTHGNTTGGYLSQLESTIGAMSTLNRFLPRTYTQMGTAVNIGYHTDYSKSRGAQGPTLTGVTGINYPNPADNSLYMAPIYLHEYVASANQPIVRGELPGLWVTLHSGDNFNHGDTFAGSGTQAGKKFEMISINTNNNTKGFWTVETSDTWNT